MADFKEVIGSVNIKEGVVMLIKRENTTFYTVVRG
jgi:hypothetical protein